MSAKNRRGRSALSCPEFSQPLSASEEEELNTFFSLHSSAKRPCIFRQSTCKLFNMNFEHLLFRSEDASYGSEEIILSKKESSVWMGVVEVQFIPEIALFGHLINSRGNILHL